MIEIILIIFIIHVGGGWHFTSGCAASGSRRSERFACQEEKVQITFSLSQWHLSSFSCWLLLLLLLWYYYYYYYYYWYCYSPVKNEDKKINRRILFANLSITLSSCFSLTLSLSTSLSLSLSLCVFFSLHCVSLPHATSVNFSSIA